MARNNNKMVKRRNKIEPSVLTMSFTAIVPKGEGGASGLLTQILDISQVTSLLNRRFYRQGLNWAVSGFKFLHQSSSGSPVGGSVLVSKLPSTWTMSNAWHKGFAAWQRMNNESLEETESVRPRFLDFKIFADDVHHAAGVSGNMVPVSALGIPAILGEWSSSKIYHPLALGAVEGATAENEIIATGASYPGPSPVSGLDAVSLIEGYAASRSLPAVLDPNTPDDARDVIGSTPENWLGAMFNDGTDQDFEVLTDMIQQNTIAPYPFENDGTNIDTMYPGGANQLTGLEVHDFDLFTATTVGGRSTIKGGLFPCGLVKFSYVNDSQLLDYSVTLTVNLVPGNHRGYLAEPMQDM